jgi:hypothetical protein
LYRTGQGYPARESKISMLKNCVFSGVEARPPKKPEKAASETGVDYSADDSGESHAANDYALVKRTRRKKVIKEKGTEKKDYGRIFASSSKL